MEQLLKSTTAYKIFREDIRSQRLSHAYMLHFRDPYNLRAALKIFAAEFFRAEGALLSRINNESYTDLTVYPQEGKKIAVDGISEIISDSALRPVEGDKKLYAITDFDSASALVQNKLLKTLEEPPEGVYFLLGAVSLAPVLGTVLSRVKTLEIPPFTAEQVYAALQRQGKNELNRAAAESCGGILGEAQAMAGGGWFKDLRAAAEKICSATDVSQISSLAKKYGDVKYKEQLLSEMGNVYFGLLKSGNSALSERALIFALDQLPRAFADVKFNAYFQGLLYDFMLKVAKENDRWLKLQE